MTRFGFCAASPLIQKGWGLAVPFYSKMVGMSVKGTPFEDKR